MPILWWFVFFLLLSCMSCFYILEVNPLSVISFTNTFFHSIGYLFTLFMVSFAVQKVLSLIGYHLLFLVFIFNTLEGGLKKILQQSMSESVLPMFPSKSFIVSILAFRFLTHFNPLLLCILLIMSFLISLFYM